MSFLIDPIKEIVHLPSIVLQHKPYDRDDVKEWLPTLFKTMTAAAFFFTTRTIFQKNDYQWDYLVLIIGAHMVQYGLDGYAFFIAQGYFSMWWGAQLLIQGFPQRETIYLVGGSLAILAGILGLDYAYYDKNEFKKAKKQDPSLSYSVADYYHHKIADAMTATPDTHSLGSTKK
ncbi:MAG: hypothetical protein JSS10_05570 [Verrucomicrobia bacterium]|nr:hypothetical protein [Verrucomicrobiota bacterium]